MEIKLQIVDIVLELRQAIDANAKGKAGKMIRVIIHETVDGRINHASAEQLDPTRLLAHRAARAAAEHARRVDFDRRLGERKIARPQARFHFTPEKFPHQIFDTTLHTAELD